MANQDLSFPKIAEANWWKLRDLFKRKVPAIITPTYLSTALSMGESSARANIIGPFKKIGIIEEDGKPTDLAYDWRDDDKYASTCKKIIEEYYPQEVKDLFHSPDSDLQQLTKWFMGQARCGEPAAKMYARFYLLLLRADPKEAENVSVKSAAKPTKATKNKTNLKNTQKKASSSQPQQKETPATSGKLQQGTILHNAPELHINIQLHISPESSPEQIDKIFESMAKHLKEFNK